MSLPQEDGALKAKKERLALVLTQVAVRAAEALRKSSELTDAITDVGVSGNDPMAAIVAGLRGDLDLSEADAREASAINDTVQDAWSTKALKAAQDLLAVQRDVYDNGVREATEAFQRSIGALA